MGLERLWLGVAYYPEHTPETEWELDARLMREMGLNCIRVGEFCWSRLQQPDGTYTFEWLARCIDLFARYGLETILCTPSACPPAWVSERFPDLDLVLPDGRRGAFGVRRHYSVFHEGYRQLAVAMADALARRFGHDPHVIGWHLDNEVGSYTTVDCSAPALAAFHRHLAAKFGTVAELNQRWGLIFWNQEVTDFSQIPAPTIAMTTRSPQYVLEYNRFALDGCAEFLRLQAAAIRPRLAPHQWVVASCPDFVSHALFRRERASGQPLLDYVEYNNYPELLTEPGQVAMRLDHLRAVDRPRDYLVLEQQFFTGHSFVGAVDDRLRRFWAWETLAHGSRAMVWFHWRRFRSGCEWWITGILERDRQPRAHYYGLQRVVREMTALAPLLQSARVTPDACILWDLDNALAWDRASVPDYPMKLQLPDAPASRLPLWEKEARECIYLPLVRCGQTVDFVQAHETWDPTRPLFLCGLDLVSDELLAKLESFVNAGGTLISLPSVGERDEWGAMREDPSPGRLGPLFGVTLADFYPLGLASGSAFDAARGGMTEQGQPLLTTAGLVAAFGMTIPVEVRQAEILRPVGAEVCGRYVGEPVDGLPAFTCRRLGAGRAIYLGATPRRAEAAARLYRQLLGLPPTPQDYQTIRIETIEGPHAFLLNGGPQPCPLPAPVQDRITGQEMAALAPFGVALIRR